MYSRASWLLSADGSLYYEARAELTLCVALFEIGKERLCRCLFDQAVVDEHRRLVDDESPPARVRIRVVGVRQEGFGPDILQASRTEMAGKIATDEVIVDRTDLGQSHVHRAFDTGVAGQPRLCRNDRTVSRTNPTRHTQANQSPSRE